MSCELTQEQRDAQNAIVEVAWSALKNTGLDPGDWMLMEWKRTGDSWNGDTLFHFKNVNTRLYVYIPSKWASADRQRGELFDAAEEVLKVWVTGAQVEAAARRLNSAVEELKR